MRLLYDKRQKQKKKPRKSMNKSVFNSFFQEFKIQKSVTTAGEEVFGSGELKAVNQTM